MSEPWMAEWLTAHIEVHEDNMPETASIILDQIATAIRDTTGNKP